MPRRGRVGLVYVKRAGPVESWDWVWGTAGAVLAVDPARWSVRAAKNHRGPAPRSDEGSVQHISTPTFTWITWVAASTFGQKRRSLREPASARGLGGTRTCSVATHSCYSAHLALESTEVNPVAAAPASALYCLYIITPFHAAWWGQPVRALPCRLAGDRATSGSRANRVELYSRGPRRDRRRHLGARLPDGACVRGDLLIGSWPNTVIPEQDTALHALGWAKAHRHRWRRHTVRVWVLRVSASWL